MIVDLPKLAVPEESAAVAAAPATPAPDTPSPDPFRSLEAQDEKARTRRRKHFLFHRALFRGSLLVWAALCVFFLTTVRAQQILHIFTLNFPLKRVNVAIPDLARKGAYAGATTGCSVRRRPHP